MDVIMVIVLYRIIHLNKRSITWVIRDGKVISPTIIIIRIICLKHGEVIIIKVLGGNKMLVHLTGKLIFKNNHYMLQSKRKRANWRIPWRNLCKHLFPIKRILKLRSEI